MPENIGIKKPYYFSSLHARAVFSFRVCRKIEIWKICRLKLANLISMQESFTFFNGFFCIFLDFRQTCPLEFKQVWGVEAQLSVSC
jgi:hypothetical protein